MLRGATMSRKSRKSWGCSTKANHFDSGGFRTIPSNTISDLRGNCHRTAVNIVAWYQMARNISFTLLPSFLRNVNKMSFYIFFCYILLSKRWFHRHKQNLSKNSINSWKMDGRTLVFNYTFSLLKDLAMLITSIFWQNIFKTKNNKICYISLNMPLTWKEHNLKWFTYRSLILLKKCV